MIWTDTPILPRMHLAGLRAGTQSIKRTTEQLTKISKENFKLVHWCQLSLTTIFKDRFSSSEQFCADVLTLAREARKRPLGVFHPTFSLLRAVQDSLLEKLPADAHRRASGKLCVSLTRLADGRNVLVSEFDSREELIQVERSRGRDWRCQNIWSLWY